MLKGKAKVLLRAKLMLWRKKKSKFVLYISAAAIAVIYYMWKRVSLFLLYRKDLCAQISSSGQAGHSSSMISETNECAERSNMYLYTSNGRASRGQSIMTVHTYTHTEKKKKQQLQLHFVIISYISTTLNHSTVIRPHQSLFFTIKLNSPFLNSLTQVRLHPKHTGNKN